MNGRFLGRAVRWRRRLTFRSPFLRISASLGDMIMPDDTANLILEYMRKFDKKLDRVVDDLSDLKRRVTAVEENLAGVHRRLDRIDDRVDRIERRLDLVEA